MNLTRNSQITNSNVDKISLPKQMLLFLRSLDVNLNLVLYFFHVDFGFQIFLCFLGNTLLYDRVVIMLERHFGKRSNGGIWKAVSRSFEGKSYTR